MIIISYKELFEVFCVENYLTIVYLIIIKLISVSKS